jgi:hypothetical protein
VVRHASGARQTDKPTDGRADGPPSAAPFVASSRRWRPDWRRRSGVRGQLVRHSSESRPLRHTDPDGRGLARRRPVIILAHGQSLLWTTMNRLKWNRRPAGRRRTNAPHCKPSPLMLQSLVRPEQSERTARHRPMFPFERPHFVFVESAGLRLFSEPTECRSCCRAVPIGESLLSVGLSVGPSVRPSGQLPPLAVVLPPSARSTPLVENGPRRRLRSDTNTQNPSSRAAAEVARPLAGFWSSGRSRADSARYSPTSRDIRTRRSTAANQQVLHWWCSWWWGDTRNVPVSSAAFV